MKQFKTLMKLTPCVLLVFEINIFDYKQPNTLLQIKSYAIKETKIKNDPPSFQARRAN